MLSTLLPPPPPPPPVPSAGLLVLQGLHAEAVGAYREALSTMELNKSLIRADALQRLHTLHNLAELLGSSSSSGGGCRAGGGSGAGGGGDGRQGGTQAGPPPGVTPTLRDGSLAGEAAALREEYLVEAVARLAAAEGELREVEEAQERVVREVALGGVGPSGTGGGGEKEEGEAVALILVFLRPCWCVLVCSPTQWLVCLMP